MIFHADLRLAGTTAAKSLTTDFLRDMVSPRFVICPHDETIVREERMVLGEHLNEDGVDRCGRHSLGESLARK
jgi:hypothetical protein